MTSAENPDTKISMTDNDTPVLPSPAPLKRPSPLQQRLKKGGKWTAEEDNTLKDIVSILGEKKWRMIAKYVKGRSAIQCLQRWSKILKPGVIKGPWSQEEDQKLMEWVTQEGAAKWSQCAKIIPGRSGKQCRERWLNNLHPEIKRGKWTAEEDNKLFELHKEFGSAWSKISTHLQGRTENCVKNRFYSTLRRNVPCSGAKDDDGLGSKTIIETSPQAERNMTRSQANESPKLFPVVPNDSWEKDHQNSQSATIKLDSGSPDIKGILLDKRQRSHAQPSNNEQDLIVDLLPSQPPVSETMPLVADHRNKNIIALLNQISDLEAVLFKARGELCFLEREFLSHVSKNFERPM